VNSAFHALVIEDERDVLALLESHLGRLGCRVSGVQNGRDGIVLAQADPPDIVFLDMMLPDIDGREVVRVLRDDARTAHCPIVVCSVLDADDVADVPADAVLAKPFARSDVTCLVELFTASFADGRRP
jgi:CheY-like chemotaxis protein